MHKPFKPCREPLVLQCIMLLARWRGSSTYLIMAQCSAQQANHICATQRPLLLFPSSPPFLGCCWSALGLQVRICHQTSSQTALLLHFQLTLPGRVIHRILHWRAGRCCLST